MSNSLNAIPKTLAVIECGISDGLHTGAQVFVSWSRQVIANLAIGESQSGIPITTDTLMPWLSASKPITAVAISQLYEQGVLDLDDPVSSHIPEFGSAEKDAITLRHVLTHTGGFRTAKVDFYRAPWELIISTICETPIETGWVPGEKAGYHVASGWFILGEMVRRLDGRPYDQYVREEVLLPLGLEDSWIGIPRARFSEYGNHLGVLEHTAKGLRSPHSFWNTPDGAALCRPGGGGRGPIRELGKFYECLLLDGGKPILSKESTGEFILRHRQGMYDETFKHLIDWGLGFMVNSNRHGVDSVPYSFGPHASEESFGHGGSQSSSAFADPDHDLVVAWVVNGTPGETRHHERNLAIQTAIYEDLDLVR